MHLSAVKASGQAKERLIAILPAPRSCCTIRAAFEPDGAGERVVSDQLLVSDSRKVVHYLRVSVTSLIAGEPILAVILSEKSELSTRCSTHQRASVPAFVRSNCLLKIARLPGGIVAGQIIILLRESGSPDKACRAVLSDFQYRPPVEMQSCRRADLFDRDSQEDQCHQGFRASGL